jgi:hypothetical protein
MMFGKNIDIIKLTAQWIPENSLGAEIGIWRARSSHVLLTKARHLHMIDSWDISVYENTTDWLNLGYEGILQRYSEIVGSNNPADFQAFYDKLYESICKEFAELPVTIHRMKSSEWFAAYTGEKLDWIYIDGDHSYEGVMADLIASLDVVKENGIIFLDDYSKQNHMHPGVRAAIIDFCYERKLKYGRVYDNQCMIELGVN